MKFLCPCGTVIRDQTDRLPYKARFIADRDFYDLIDQLEATVTWAVEHLTQPAADSAAAPPVRAGAIIEGAQKTIHRLVWDYARREMYQCPHCGRLHLDDGPAASLHTFAPADAAVSKALLGSIEGDRWRRSIHGEWVSQPWAHRPQPGWLRWGDYVVAEAGVVDADEWFETWADLESRYHDMVAQAQADGTLLGAMLVRDNQAVHDWSADEWAQRVRQQYTIWITAEDPMLVVGRPRDDQTTVRVTFADGTRWFATVVRATHIAAHMRADRRSGEHLGGRYFWVPDMLVVDVLSRERIEEVVADLLAAGWFEDVFKRG